MREATNTLRARIFAKLVALSANAWFAYATILLLQLKVAWGMWTVRDLTSGDTSSYFVIAWKWYHNGTTSIVWSPLYTSFYSLFFHLSHDAFTVTTAHRLVIVLILDILVLALMRALLPKPLAWLMAAWWTILPINFDALYEVHLFAVIPMLLAALMVHWTPGRWGRGGSLGILFAASLLMRNELLLATGMFGIFVAISELRTAKSERRVVSLLSAYGIPLALAGLLAIFFYSRAEDRPVLRQMVERKHTLNVCQAYTFGYQQRHSDWKGSPWTDCQHLMTRTFGVAEPSFTEAAIRNPQAMLGHFFWNLRLLPDGLEVLLFNAAFGTIDPDYAPVRSGSWLALALAIVFLCIVLAGVIQLWRFRDMWWTTWLHDRLWVWLVLGCFSAVVLIVVVLERPRPSYMFILGIALRAAVGACIVAIAGRRSDFIRLSAAFPAVAILGILAIPSFYKPTAPHTPRLLLNNYKRLLPFEPLLEHPHTRLVSGGFGSELCNYLGKGADCAGLYYWGLRNSIRPALPLADILEQNGANLFFANEMVLADPTARDFVASAASRGWKTIGFQDGGGQHWTLLQKSSPPQRPSAGIVTGRYEIRLGTGWYTPETYGGLHFRWAANDAQILIPPCKPVDYIVYLDLEPGPGIFHLPLRLRVSDATGNVVKRAELSGRQIVEVPLPPTANQSIVLTLHIDGGGKPTPHDPRTLNFRAFRIELK